MPIKELDRVVLTAGVPAEGLEAGDVGTVVHAYEDGRAFELEFTTLEGATAAVVTVEAAAARPVGNREITHAVIIFSLDDAMVFNVLDAVEKRGDWHGKWEGAVRPDLELKTEYLDGTLRETAYEAGSLSRHNDSGHEGG